MGYRKGEALDAKNTCRNSWDDFERRSHFSLRKNEPLVDFAKGFTSYCGVCEIDDGNLGP